MLEPRAIARRIAWHPWRLLLPALLFALAGVSHVYQERVERADARFLDAVAGQALLAERAARFAALAAAEDDAAARALVETRRRAGTALEGLAPPRAPFDLWVAPSGIGAQLAALGNGWGRLAERAQRLAETHAAHLALEQELARFQAAATRILIVADDLVAALVEVEEPPEQVRVAARQLLLIERMLANAERMRAGGHGVLTAADRFGRDAVLFGDVNNGLLNGNPELGIARVDDDAAREILSDLGRRFRDMTGVVEQVVKQSVNTASVGDAVDGVVRAAQAITERVREVETAYAGAIAGRPWQPAHTTLFAALGVAALVLGAVLMGLDARAYKRQERRRAVDAERQSQAVEEAAARAGEGVRQAGEELTRLLADLGRVVEVETAPAPGEDAGEALARGLRRVLRELHGRIDVVVTGAHQAASSAASLKETAAKLNASGRQQTQHVEKAASATQELATSVKVASKAFAKFDTLSEATVTEARAVHEHIGAAVRDLDGLGASVKEASRRVRRLADEAGEARSIAMRIDEISDHSKMLALNVAIQSSAEAARSSSGTSFADELQRLAERARAAVQAVEGMRESLRTDSDEAIKAIKHSAWVVASADEHLRKAERPIASLNQLARKLEKFSQSFVSSSQEQTLRAAEVVRAVTAVHAVAGQAGVGAEAAAASAARLAETLGTLEAHVSRLHPVAVEEPKVLELGAEPDEAKAAPERKQARTAKLRPVS